MDVILRSASRTFFPDVTVTVVDLLDDGDVVRECRITVGKTTVTVSSRYLTPDEGSEELLRELEVITQAIETLRGKGLPLMQKGGTA